MITIYLDPEIRAHLVEYFTKSINHSYSDAKYVRMLLKAQNLTINDILIPSQALQQAGTDSNSKCISTASASAFQSHQKDENDWDKTPGEETDRENLIGFKEPTTIKPIPSNKDIDDLEYCYNNLEFLTASRQKFILDNFKSRKDNIVTKSNNDMLSAPRRRYVNICLELIAKEIKG